MKSPPLMLVIFNEVSSSDARDLQWSLLLWCSWSSMKSPPLMLVIFNEVSSSDARDLQWSLLLWCSWSSMKSPPLMLVIFKNGYNSKKLWKYVRNVLAHSEHKCHHKLLSHLTCEYEPHHSVLEHCLSGLLLIVILPFYTYHSFWIKMLALAWAPSHNIRSYPLLSVQ